MRDWQNRRPYQAQERAAFEHNARRRALKAVVVGLAATVGLAALAIWQHWIEIPDAWSPLATLRIDEKPNLLTRFKLSRLSGDGRLCGNVLSTADMSFERLSDRETGPGCSFHDAVRIDGTTARVGKPFTLTCRAAVSLALWERHVLQPAAIEYLGAPVAELEHFGSYACRNIYNRPDATRSRHATAEAVDIAGFGLADGRRIRVMHDWSEGSDEGRFLHDVRDGACSFFDGVLSPDYNAAHRDHLHLDRGSYRMCR